MTAQLDVRPAAARDHTAIGWLDSWHSFSFGHHYDPENTHHGVLLVSNDDRILPKTGFDTHPHRDMEIITWVLDGGVVHQDSEGNHGLIVPGLAQRMSAGTGILHSEKNDGVSGGTDGTHFVQMWVVPDTPGVRPGYQEADVRELLDRGGLVPVAAGERVPDAAITIRQRDAALWVARLSAGETVTVPDAPFLHVFVARGDVELEGAGPLVEGDAVRVVGEGGQQLTGGGDGAEVIVWEMHATLR